MKYFIILKKTWLLVSSFKKHNIRADECGGPVECKPLSSFVVKNFLYSNSSVTESLWHLFPLCFSFLLLEVFHWCVGVGVEVGLLIPMWVHLETRVRCHMSYPAPLHLVPLRYGISLTLKLGWWTVNPSGLPVNCHIWFFPLFRFYLCVCVYLCVYICFLDSLQLELSKVVSHNVDARTKPGFPAKVAISPAPTFASYIPYITQASASSSNLFCLLILCI